MSAIIVFGMFLVGFFCGVWVYRSYGSMIEGVSAGLVMRKQIKNLDSLMREVKKQEKILKEKRKEGEDSDN